MEGALGVLSSDMGVQYRDMAADWLERDSVLVTQVLVGQSTQTVGGMTTNPAVQRTFSVLKKIYHKNNTSCMSPCAPAVPSLSLRC